MEIDSLLARAIFIAQTLPVPRIFANMNNWRSLIHCTQVFSIRGAAAPAGAFAVR
jgi:hypothetical protein